FNHNRLDSHGSGKGRGKPEWQSILRQLVAGGYLELDVEGYGGMAIALRGQAILRDEETFPYRPDATPQAKAKGNARRATKTANPAAGEEQNLSERDLDLLGALKALRSTLSKARNVPAYVVFSDRSLADMAQQRPTSVAEFANIHGVGQAKLKKFAAQFMVVISEHNQ
ncbi:MAG: ATP-dependent DNA helicase RecQ, partial [Rhodospirillaceae bacterium]|nr:ATP-dependent DNA helicase RecQ [Rhodospirillaceae bacterium]